MRGRLIRRLICGLLISTPAFLLAPAAVQAEAFRNNFGTVGLIDMPNARMAPDGELSAGASVMENTEHFNLGFQALPWLETNFRYSGLNNFDPSYPVYYDRSFGVKIRLWDEDGARPAVSLGINDVVGTGVYSGEYLVATKRFGDFDATLGLGWGRFASKAQFRNPLTVISSGFRNRADLTTPGGTNFNVFLHGPNSSVFGGISWHTPLDGLVLNAEYSSDAYSLESDRGSFMPRNQINLSAGYELTDQIGISAEWMYGRSFGANINFALDPVHALYPTKIAPPVPVPRTRTPEAQQQALNTILRQRDPGAQASTALASQARGDFVDALLASGKFSDIALRGRTLELTESGSGQGCTNIARALAPYQTDVDVLVLNARLRKERCQIPRLITADLRLNKTPFTVTDFTLPQATNLSVIDAAKPTRQDKAAAIRTIRADLARQEIGIRAVALDDSKATVYYTNGRYLSEVEALNRLTDVLMNDAPDSVEEFDLLNVAVGLPQQKFTVLRGTYERSLAQDEDPNIFNGAASVAPAPLKNPVLDAAGRKTYPEFFWTAYPQMREAFFDPNNPLGIQFLAAGGGGVTVMPGLTLDAELEVSLYDTFPTARRTDSLLPHVRSDFNKYFLDGRTGIGRMAAEYRFRLSPTVYAALKGGYFESMFGGAGGEVLWRPENQRWALGADVYEVFQRNYDRLFNFLPYHQVTGHVSLYYQSPWYGMNFMVRAGQYLAGDRGLTMQITRRFSTGVEIGAFFTKTNVSADQFGEGAFDKGIIIRIPLDWMMPISTRGGLGLDLRPVQRDGGQRLLNDSTLFGTTQSASVGEIHNDYPLAQLP